MRFGVSHVLDAIERRITTDPTAAGGVVDLTEIVRLADLDGGRPAHLLRLGLVIDALARHMSDGGVAVYPVAQRALLSDTDLTANERMVIRRWSDDGLVEVVPAEVPALARVCEITTLIGQPVITRAPLRGYQGIRFSPVNAPDFSQCKFCAPSFTFCASPKSSDAFASTVNGGTITISTRFSLPISRRNVSMNDCDSVTLMFIFQFAAMIFLRIKF